MLERELPVSPSRPVRQLLPAIGVFILSLILFLSAEYRPEPADSRPVVATVARVVSHGDRDLTTLDADATAPKEGSLPHYLRTVPNRDGLYSSYPAGMELFAWPGVLLARLSGANVGSKPTRYAIEFRTAAVVAAASLVLFYLIALRFGPPAAAGAVTLLLATGSVFQTLLGQLLWQQTGVVFWSLVVLFVELRAGKVGTRDTVLQGVAVAMMVACRPSAATFVLPFGAWALARDRRRAAVLVASAAVAYLPWALLYQHVYGQPFGPAMGFVAGGHPSDAGYAAGNGWEFGRHLGGVLFSPGRGLLIYQPWAWLVLLLFCRTIRTDANQPLPRGWYAFAVGFLAFHLLLVGSWRVWWGGVCWGSRLAAEVVPVCGLLAVRPTAWLLERWWGRGVLVLVFALGIAVHAPAMYGSGLWWDNTPPGVDRDPGRLWDWQNPPFLYRRGDHSSPLAA